MGTSTWMFLEMDAVSISMWTICACRCKLVELAGDTVVETGSDGEQEVAVADCHVCSIGTMHSKVSDE